MDIEITDFIKKTSENHKRINPCFMNGKGCVYTEQIDREIEKRRNNNASDSTDTTLKDFIAGFMILPFQPNISTFYELCLKKFILEIYPSQQVKINMIRADQVRKTGYVICEKICKKIQESDFVIVDVSLPNANVFYELGLSYGIDQKIIVIHHEKSSFGKRVTEYLAEAGCTPFSYNNLDPITIERFPLSNHIWKRENRPFTEPTPTMLVFEDITYHIKEEEQETVEQRIIENHKDIPLGFATHIKAAIRVAIDNICERPKNDYENKIPDSYFEEIKNLIPDSYFEEINKLKTSELVKKATNFNEIRSKIDQSFCSIIKTGGDECNPMMYFWLGYCHAIGKNVIPITEFYKDQEKINDLAFDIRALWHLIFYVDVPKDLTLEIEGILYQMILNDFSELSRKRFWDEVLDKRGKVSIFTGALHNPIGREMIGDWDLRAASELTSFFASHQYRATIESPVYQIEQVVNQQKAVDRNEYIKQLENMLTDKNCIIIASPDVNPLTEIVLGKIYGIDKKLLFCSTTSIKGTPNAVVSIKQKRADDKTNKGEDTTVNRAFYREDVHKSKRALKRGFYASFLKQGEILGEFVSQNEDPKEFVIHAHMLIAPNPYIIDEHKEMDKYIIILNGVSGPATFALTHVLTGGMSDEFVAYSEIFKPSFKSEDILSRVIKDLNTLKERKETALQYIIEVTVGSPEKTVSKADMKSRDIFDWRHIKRWKLVQTNNLIQSSIATQQ